MPCCSRCRQPIEADDCYCRHCGKALRPRMGFWYDHGGVLLMTLIVGPFSLIPLWLSAKLSLSAKWIWTAGIGLFSAYFIYALYRSVLAIQQAAAYILPQGL